jgi:hypothetical protein
LWNESKQLQFSLSDASLDNVGSFTAGAVENAGLRFLCDVKRMDELLAEEKRIDFIKMDIEGAELNALRGAEMLIEKHRPQFLIEINRAACLGFGYDPQEIADFFARWGYEFYQVGDTVGRSRWIHDFSHIQQANVLVVNEKRKNKIPMDWQAKAIKRKFIEAQA